MQNFIDLLRDVRDNGRTRGDRTGTGTISVFDRHLRWNLNSGYPLVTTKKCHMRSIIHELLWFISGDTNIKYLNDNGVTIWDEWAAKEDVTVFARRVEIKDVKRHLMEVLGMSLHPAEQAMQMAFEKGIADEYSKDGADSPTRMIRVLRDMKILTETEVVLPTVVRKIRKGDLGPVYGEMMRAFPGADGTVDQLKELIKGLVSHPFSRRHIVDLWCPSLLPDESLSIEENVKNGKQALAPCHYGFQCYVEELTDKERYRRYTDKHDIGRGNVPEDMERLLEVARIPKYRLSLKWNQRSGDGFLGIPFNIASYALLTHMIAHNLNMAVGTLSVSLGDTHIYSNHLEQVDLQLSREPLPLPQLKIKCPVGTSIFDMKFDDFEVVGYESHPGIKAPISK